MNTPTMPLVADLTHLIDAARTRAAVAVNAEITLLYWQVGQRIRAEVLQEQRANYGKQLVAQAAVSLTQQYGKGWSEKQLRHCLRFAEIYPDETIVSALRRQFTWTQQSIINARKRFLTE